MALAQTGSACTEDFIIIEGSSSTCTLNPNTNRYCGSHLNDDNMAKASVSICGKFQNGIFIEKPDQFIFAILTKRNILKFQLNRTTF